MSGVATGGVRLSEVGAATMSTLMQSHFNLSIHLHTEHATCRPAGL